MRTPEEREKERQRGRGKRIFEGVEVFKSDRKEEGERKGATEKFMISR